MRILTTEDGPGAGPARHRGRRGRVVSVPALGITALLTTSAGLAWSIIQTPLPGTPATADTAFPDLIRQRSEAPPQISTPTSTPSPATPAAAAATAIGSSTATPEQTQRAPTAAPSTPPSAGPTSPPPSRLPGAGTGSTPTFSLAAATRAQTSGTAVITGFAYDGASPSATATVTVRVTAPSTAPLTLVLVYAGGNQSGVPGDNAPLEHDIQLSGQTSYVVTDTVDTLQFCYTTYFGVQASAGSYGQAPTDYRSLRAPLCT